MQATRSRIASEADAAAVLTPESTPTASQDPRYALHQRKKLAPLNVRALSARGVENKSKKVRKLKRVVRTARSL